MAVLLLHLWLCCQLLVFLLWFRFRFQIPRRVLYQRSWLVILFALGAMFAYLNLYAEWRLASVSDRPATVEELKEAADEVLAVFPFDHRLSRAAEMYRTAAGFQ